MAGPDSATPADLTSEMEMVIRPVGVADVRPGVTEVVLMREGKPISGCKIIPLTLRVGEAAVRIDGIGEVYTDGEHRYRGYSRRVLTAAIDYMTAGDGALTLLYGIPNFYPKFGYITAGPEYTLTVTLRVPEPGLSAGWSVRRFRPGDLAACRALYDREAARVVGAVARAPGVYPWTQMDGSASGGGQRDECRVVCDPQGEIGGYVWHLPDFWHVQIISWENQQSMVLAEAVARDAPAADAVLAVCRLWAGEEAARRGEVVVNVMFGIPPESPVAAASRRGAATFQERSSASGAFMAHTLHTGRLLRQLAPELGRRVGEARTSFDGLLQIETEDGEATLRISGEGVDVVDGPVAGAGGDRQVVRLPQTALARLALGAFSPDDLLAGLDEPPRGAVREVLEAMFPRRHPHIYLPDRF